MNLNDLTNAYGNAVEAVSDFVEDNTAPVAPPTVPTSQQLQSAGEKLFDGAIEFGKAAKDFVMDDEVWGDDMKTDDGKNPTRFGYGENKNTLGELSVGPQWNTNGNDVRGWDAPEMHEVAAKLRLFGHASAENISASIGLETESGYHGTKDTFPASGSSPMQEEGFAGFRGRVFGEAGLLGIGAGADAFLGGKYNYDYDNSNRGFDRWHSTHNSAELGIRGALSGSLDVMSADVKARLQAGLDIRTEHKDHQPILPDIGIPGVVAIDDVNLGLMTRQSLNIFAGVAVEAQASIGSTGVSAGVDAFAGVRATWEHGLSVAHNGEELIGGVFRVEGRLGIGATAEVDLGVDWKNKTLGLNVDVGAAVGVGAAIGGGVQIGGKQVTKAVGLGD